MNANQGAMKPGYRKFTVAVLALAAASVLVFLGKISDGVYSTIVVTVVSGYLGTNVWQKLGLKGESS